MGIRQELVFKVARRWISGKDIKTGIEGAKYANTRGMSAILNYLGEEVSDPTVAQKEFDEYSALQKAISLEGVRGCVSVKLTQVGLMLDESVALQRIEALATAADALGQDLWIDMEGSAFTDRTLDVYLNTVQGHRRTGVAIQAYLKRSESDLTRLLDAGGRVRLVKGAYREPLDKVYSSRAEIRGNYSRLMRTLFDRGTGFAIATHDSRLIDEARGLASARAVPFEFQMLKGIRDDLKPGLIAEGLSVAEYIPYGDQWYPYSMRRMREHPSNVWLLLRSIF